MSLTGPTPRNERLTPTPTLLTPSLPPKTLVGIDLITFTSTPNFHGIRDIPPGWHFLYTGTTEGLSLRLGGWFYVNGQHDTGRTGADEILVWRWDDNLECLEPLRQDQKSEGMRFRANIGGLYSSGGLFKYRSRVTKGLVQKGTGSGVSEINDEDEEEGRREWSDLTKWLSARLLSRITGEPGVDWEQRPRWVVTSGSTARQDDDDIPGLESAPRPDTDDAEAPGAGNTGPKRPEDNEEREFSFLPVDLKMTWREGAIGRERTEAARDRSWALGEIIQRVSSSPSSPGVDSDDIDSGEAQILGELQFTFLMGLTIMNYSCLQQWRRLLRLILTCRRAVAERASFYTKLLRLLLLQLKRCDDVEGGLFDQLGSEGGAEGADFLRKPLRAFRTALNEALEDGEASALESVKAAFKELEEWVKEEFDWELDRDAVLRKGMVQLEDGEEVELEMLDHEEEEEYAPVVVDLDDAQMYGELR
ncbi:A1 cistron-splicing factor [Aspergillus unguis]